MADLMALFSAKNDAWDAYQKARTAFETALGVVKHGERLTITFEGRLPQSWDSPRDAWQSAGLRVFERRTSKNGAGCWHNVDAAGKRTSQTTVEVIRDVFEYARKRNGVVVVQDQAEVQP